MIEQRAAPHSTKSTQVWRGQYAFTIRRNWRQALSRAATNESAAQLAYCVVAFSERMQHQLAALERQGKKAAKLRGDDGRAPSGRPSRAKRARTVRARLRLPPSHLGSAAECDGKTEHTDGATSLRRRRRASSSSSTLQIQTRAS